MVHKLGIDVGTTTRKNGEVFETITMEQMSNNEKDSPDG